MDPVYDAPAITSVSTSQTLLIDAAFADILSRNWPTGP